MRLDTATTDKIRDCLVGIIDPVRIVVFGSYARSEASANSDIDIAAITSGALATRENLIKSRVALREALKGSGPAIDFILQSAEQFDLASQQKGSIQEAIVTEGLVIYARE